MNCLPLLLQISIWLKLIALFCSLTQLENKRPSQRRTVWENCVAWVWVQTWCVGYILCLFSVCLCRFAWFLQSGNAPEFCQTPLEFLIFLGHVQAVTLNEQNAHDIITDVLVKHQQKGSHWFLLLFINIAATVHHCHWNLLGLVKFLCSTGEISRSQACGELMLCFRMSLTWSRQVVSLGPFQTLCCRT